MIRTDVVRLTTLKAVAYRQKLPTGDTGIIIVRPDHKQPGIASLSKKTGEPVPTANTNTKLFPAEAFQEAFVLTSGMQLRRQGSVKVTKGMFAREKAEKESEVIEMNEEAFKKIVAHYTDKDGKLSYDLINKELIRFARSSSIVRGMAADGKSVAQIRDYIVGNKFRNIAEEDLSDGELKLIVEALNEAQNKGVFKDLNEELKKMLAKNKRG